MLRLTIRVDAQRLAQELARVPGRLRIALARGLRRASEVVVKEAKLNLRANRSMNTGALAASIGYRVDETKLLSTIGPGLVSKAGASADQNYGAFVEYGRKPGRMPPPIALRQWIRRKMGRDPDGPGLRGTGRLGFIIARAIAAKGTKPAPFLAPAMNTSQGRMAAAFENELAREIADMGGRK